MSGRKIHVNEIRHMIERRLKDISQPLLYPPHFFRVSIIPDLLEQGVPLADIQRLAGYTEPC